MQVKTTRFGTFKIEPHKNLTFPRGIPGFEQLRRFFILPVEGTSDMHWVQSVDDPAVALLVIDPFKFFPGYSCSLSDADIAEMELAQPQDALVLAVITVPGDNPRAATANLVAPIVINTKNNRGKQVILTGSPYTTKHSLFPANAQTGSRKDKQPIPQRSEKPPREDQCNNPCSVEAESDSHGTQESLRRSTNLIDGRGK